MADAFKAIFQQLNLIVDVYFYSGSRRRMGHTPMWYILNQSRGKYHVLLMICLVVRLPYDSRTNKRLNQKINYTQLCTTEL